MSVVTCDVGDFESIRRAAARLLSEWPRLDVLVHNAGATFPQRTMTADGIEATLAVDVAGPFLLTTLLCRRLETCRGRVITLTGIYQRRGISTRTTSTLPIGRTTGSPPTIRRSVADGCSCPSWRGALHG